MKIVKVVLYAGVSTLDKGQDPENRLRELRSFVQRKASEGWTLAHEYVDRASGKTAEKRPAFRKMLDAASREEKTTQMSAALRPRLPAPLLPHYRELFA